MSSLLRAPARWRLLVHALDRTGPPVLVRTIARWLAVERPDDQVEVLAFRGGPLEGELRAAGAEVLVVLDDEEPWDHVSPDPARLASLTGRLASLRPVDGNVLVSSSASQILPLLREGLGPVVCWSVEVGEDLRWFDLPVGLLERTDHWWAGSATTATELRRRLPPGVPVQVVEEFVEVPSPVRDEACAATRQELGLPQEAAVALGIGIGTYRKGLDLFLEVAAAARRSSAGSLHLRWIGGERDPLAPLVAGEIDRLALTNVALLPSQADLGSLLGVADVLVHSARTDAFPLVALHAAAAGVPVVSFLGCGGLEEMFGEHHRGVPYPDVNGLARLAISVAHRDPEYRELAVLQQQRVLERYVDAVAMPVLVGRLEELLP